MSNTWLTGQIDYLLLWHGLALAMLAGVCIKLSRSQALMSWGWLGLFGLLHAPGKWLDMFALSLPDHPAIGIARTVVMIGGWLSLLEFGRQAWLRRSWGPGRWIYPILLLGFAAVSSVAGISSLHMSYSYGLVLPGGMIAAWCLLREARQPGQTSRWPLSIGGVALFGYALTSALGTPTAGWSASVPDQRTCVVIVGLCTPLASALCAAALTFALALILRGHAERRGNRLPDGLLSAGALALLVGGWCVTDWCGRNTDEEMRERILFQAIKIADTIDPAHVRTLSFTARDKDQPEFQRLHRQLAAFGQTIQQRSIYSMALRQGNILFGPENLDETDPMASPPGTIYREPTPENFTIHSNGRPYTEGPYTDEYGTFVSGFAPVRDPRTGKVLMVVGLDILADDWQSGVARGRVVPILFTWALALVTILTTSSGRWAKWRESLRPGTRRSVYSSTLLTVGTYGLVLTVVATYLAHHAEIGSHRQTFAQVANGLAASVEDSMHDLRDHQMAGLARFFEGSDQVSREEFTVYAGPLAGSTAGAAFEWAPSVPAAERGNIEASVRTEGLDCFTLFETGPDGESRPAMKRETYYPVLYIEPLTGNEHMLGFDVGSEPIRSAALAEASRTRLPTATTPLVDQRGNGRPSLLLCYPVFTKHESSPTTQPDQAGPRTLRGFTLTTLCPQSTLEEAMAYLDSENVIAEIEWLHLTLGEAPHSLASWPKASERHNAAHPLNLAGANTGPLNIFPLFAFGQSYAIVIRPGPAFLAAHPTRAGWIVGLVGLLLTGGVTGLIGTMASRRAVLQREMEIHTASLEMSKKAGAAAQREEVRARTLLELSQMADLTGWQLSEHALEAGIQLTASKIGYIAFASEDERTLTIAHWSKSAMAQCAMIEKPIVYAVQDTGLWGEAVRQRKPVITNDYQAPNAHKKGIPSGHVCLTRHMNVPIFDGARIVAVAGVGNKETDYTAEDVSQLCLLMDGMWKILGRKQAEAALRESEEKHRAIYESSRDALMVLSLATSRFTSGNPAAIELFAAKDEAHFCSVGPAEVSPKYQPDGELSSIVAGKMIQTALTEGSHYFEWVHRRLDGRDFTATVLLTRVSLKGETLLQATVRDITEQRSAEQEIRSLSRFPAENPNAVLRAGTDGCLLYANQASDPLLAAWNAEVGQRLPEPCQTCIQAALDKAAPHEVEIAAAGRVYSCMFAPVADSGYVNLYASDITDRKRAEAALRMSEQRLSWALQAGEGGAWDWDLSSGSAWWSPEMYDLWGVPADMPTDTEHSLALIDVRDRARVEQTIANYLETGATPHWEFRVHHPVRGERWMVSRARIARDDTGRPVHLLGITLDITQRKQADETVRLQSSALQAAANGIVVTDRKGNITWVNPAFTQLTGYTIDEVLGGSPGLLKSGMHDEDFCHDLWETINAGRAWRGEIVNRRKDGSLYTEDMTVTAVRDESGDITHFVAIKQDVTNRKRAEEELALKTTLLEAQSETSIDGILAVDGDSTIILANARFGELWGLGRSPRVGTPDDQVLADVMLAVKDPDSFVKTVQEIYACPERKTRDEIELNDGRVLDRYSSPLVDAAGTNHGRIWYFRDVTDRKRAEKAIQKSERFARSTLDGLAAHLAIVDQRGECLAVNRAWRDFARDNSDGATEVCEGANYLSACDNAVGDERGQATAFAAGLRAVLQGDTDKFEIEYACHAPDQQRWFMSRVTRFPGDGAPRAIIAHEDITQRVQAEQAILTSEAHYRQLHESMRDAYVRVDMDGRIREFNDAYRSLVGYAADELKGMTYRELTPPQWHELEAGIVAEQILPRGYSDIYTKEYRRKDGTLVPVELRTLLLRDQAGHPTGMWAIVLDITQRLLAERALSDTLKHQVALNRLQQDLLGPGDLVEKLKKLTDGVVRLFEADFSRIWISKTADLCEAGCVHADADNQLEVCRSRDRCLHLMASSGRYTHVDGQAHRRVPFGCYKIGRVASGEEPGFLTNDVTTDPWVHNHDWAKDLGLVSFAGYQLRPPGGETIGVLALFSTHVITPEDDAMLVSLANTATQVITGARIEDEQRALELQLVQAQRLESVGQLAAGIAHEINTPTQFVSDNTRFLRNAFPKLEDLLTRYRQLLAACRAGEVPASLLEEIEAATSKAKLDYLLEQVPEALSDSLEGLERVTKIVRAMKDFSHPGQQGMCTADLNKAIESTITVARNEWKYVAEMVLDLDPSLPLVPCLVGDFNQVVLNLVVNAAHAIQDVIANGSASKGTITVSTRHTEHQIEVRIADTGTGIPETHRARVFDHFFTTKEVGKGTGQGLTIARQVIVEKHHGTLTFETETGRGTTFIIRLPIDAEPATTMETPEHEEVHSVC